MENDDLNEKEIEQIKDWRNEHGEPDFPYLESLVLDGSPDALAQLQSIADDLDVPYDSNASPADLLEIIRSAEEDESNPVA